MYGYYELPVKIEKNGITISLEKEDGKLRYKRESPSEENEKLISAKKLKLLINPVEPLRKPKDISSNLLIEFENKIMVEPKVSTKFYIKFPIEIGIFISGNKKNEVLDVLTLTKPKFALYGEIVKGIICKYYKSDVFSSVPEIDPLIEGVIELNIINNNSFWVEVNKVVFNAYGMEIYYDNNLVSMKANMKITRKNMAETEFIDKAVRDNMKKSLELYASRSEKVVSPKFIMFGGI